MGGMNERLKDEARRSTFFEAEILALRAEVETLKAKLTTAQGLLYSAEREAETYQALWRIAESKLAALKPSEPPHNFLNRGVQRIGRPLPE